LDPRVHYITINTDFLPIPENPYLQTVSRNYLSLLQKVHAGVAFKILTHVRVDIFPALGY
jgi:hypothetical protein